LQVYSDPSTSGQSPKLDRCNREVVSSSYQRASYQGHDGQATLGKVSLPEHGDGVGLSAVIRNCIQNFDLKILTNLTGEQDKSMLKIIFPIAQWLFISLQVKDKSSKFEGFTFIRG
jgi:hypothetical protein